MITRRGWIHVNASLMKWGARGALSLKAKVTYALLWLLRRRKAQALTWASIWERRCSKEVDVVSPKVMDGLLRNEGDCYLAVVLGERCGHREPRLLTSQCCGMKSPEAERIGKWLEARSNLLSDYCR